MDQRILLGVIAVALLAGCSRESSESAAAPQAANYQSQTTYEFQADEVSGELLRPGSGGDPAGGDENPGTANIEANGAAAQRMQEATAELSRADMARVEALLEAQKMGVLGALGGSSFSAEPSLQPAPPLPPAGSDSNPLRSALNDLPKPAPAGPNPLRQPRIATGLTKAAEPAFEPGPAVAEQPSVASANPSGGAAMPPGGLDEILRAFTETAASPGSAGSSEPTAVGEIGPGAPQTSAVVADVAPSTTDSVTLGGSGLEPRNNDPFNVVEVFYGTDRQSTEAQSSDWRRVLMQFVPAASIALMALCFGFAAAGRKSWVLWAAAGGAIVLSLGLGYRASAEALATIRSAGKQGPRYTTQRSINGQVELGRCEVSIPKTHERGELESPSIVRLEVFENAADHVILSTTQRLEDAEFYGRLRERIEASDRRELFVFVHGFNVSFEDAARRTAQIHHDLKFDGAPIFFSWPANDKFIFTYPADETNVAWSVPHLKQFLLSIVKESQAKSINLIAHSMGNRARAAALKEIDLEMRGQSRLFNQVILAAPDIDADDFRHNIAPAMQRTAQRLTMYVSSHDEALLASQFVHRGPRAGDAGDGLIVLDGVDTIDVTAIDSSLWGHAYYGSSHPVLQDLRTLLSMAIPPSDRTWLSPAQRDGLTYWIFQPLRTAAADSAPAR
jgi:esterase/lipase superfamily enzyme